MTLDEAIKYMENISEENQRIVDTGIVFDDVTIDMLYCDDTEVIDEHLANYQRCANEQRQLAEWLRELVHLRNITEYLRDMVTCFEFINSMHYNEDIIEWAESELRVDMREANADGKEETT